MILIAALCLAYLMGSIPTGLLVVRLTKGLDVRQQGSGNVGATNVYRTAGKLAGIFVLAVDGLKGWVPAALLADWAASFGGGPSLHTFRILLGAAAVAGHIWNPFLQFKGGKGVATAMGLLLALDPRVALSCFAVWMTVVLLTRYVSLASVAAAFCAPFLVTLMGGPTSWTMGSVAVALAVIARHRPNLLRLLHGEENRFGRG